MEKKYIMNENDYNLINKNLEAIDEYARDIINRMDFDQDKGTVDWYANQIRTLEGYIKRKMKS